MEDEKIVELFLSRDNDAIIQTAEKYGERLRRIAQRITGDALTAEECENDTYMEAWNRIPPHEPREYLFPFLARIVRHVAINCCARQEAQKRNAVMTELTEEMEQCLPAGENVESVLDEEELGKSISRFLYTCPPEKRILFMRRYFYMEPVAQIALRYGLTESNVKTSLFRMRKALRSYLEKKGYHV